MFTWGFLPISYDVPVYISYISPTFGAPIAGYAFPARGLTAMIESCYVESPICLLGSVNCDFKLMRQTNESGLRAPYEAPRAEFLKVAFGQSILVSGSGTLPDTIGEGDEDTFEPLP